MDFGKGATQNLIINAINNLEQQICCIREDSGGGIVNTVTLTADASTQLRFVSGGTGANPTFNLQWVSPVVGSGFLGVTGSGPGATITLRPLVVADIPSLSTSQITSGVFPVARLSSTIPPYPAGSYLDSAGQFTVPPGAVSSIGLAMPTAFSVAGSPLTSSGTLTVTMPGTIGQLLRGDGTLATVPVSSLVIGSDGTGQLVSGTTNVPLVPLTGYVLGTVTAVVATDTINQAIGKLQAQVSNRINNQVTVQSNSSFNIDTRAIVTQANRASSTGSPGLAGMSPLTVTGGAGGDTTQNTGTPIGGSAGAINITGGQGGAIAGTPTAGFAGKGGGINLTGGNGGTALSGGTTVGAGGDIEVAGGTSGLGSNISVAARAGYVSLKGGNAATSALNNNGGDIFAVSGIPNGTGIPGGIFMNCSPSNTIRGTTFFSCNTGDLTAGQPYSMFVRGQAYFVDEPTKGQAAVNNDEFVTKAQLLGVGANPSNPIGLTAINGVALSYMRSDAAPALSQAITPVWTNVHTFTLGAISKYLSAAVDGTSLASPTNTGVYIMAASTYADINLYDASQAVNARSFDIINFQNKVQFRLKNDAGSTVVTPLTFDGGFAGYTGITSNSGSGAWVHTGGFSLPYRAETTTYAITKADYTIDCDGTFTATLPTAVGAAGQIYNIINSGIGVITVATTSSQTIGNTPSDPTSVIVNAGSNLQVQSTGSKWRIL